MRRLAIKTFSLALVAAAAPGCLLDVMTTTAIQGELAKENATAATRALDQAQRTADDVSSRNASLNAQPQPITAADRANKEKIRQAINSYGQAVGYYPPSLQALVQYGYLDELPKTSNGQDFIFYPENGALYHPAELARQQQPNAQPQANRNRAGGAGPLGETMTGIGIQRELNGMNQSGVSNAGNAARSGARGVAGNYGDRQMQAVKELGLDP